VKNLKAGDAERGAMVDHHTVHRGDVNNRHQAHGVARGVRACPAVAGGEGCRGWYDRHLAWHGCSTLGHVDEMVEVTAPLRPQLRPRVHARV
jgi:hypothetical protein